MDSSCIISSLNPEASRLEKGKSINVTNCHVPPLDMFSVRYTEFTSLFSLNILINYN